MIRFVTRTFLGLVAVAALTGTAQAALIPATWTDEYLPLAQVVDHDTPAIYAHDITADGFNVGSDIVTNFLLTIDLFDDEKDGYEKAYIDIPGFLGDSYVYDFQFGDGAYVGASIAGLFELTLLGQLSVTIKAISGDFYLAGSHLVANGLARVASVPEPGTLGLLGLGMLGIAFGARRRATQS